MNSLKKFEEYNINEEIDIINKSEIDSVNTWSPRHLIYTRKGLKAFRKTGYNLTEVTILNRSTDKNLIYMTQENADTLNALGEGVSNNIEFFNTQLQEFTENVPDGTVNMGNSNLETRG